MTVETISCPRCGFEALYVGAGRRGRLNEDVIEKSQVCIHGKHGGDPLSCPHFDAELTRPRPAGR